MSRPALEFTTPPYRWIPTACSHFGWPYISIECRKPALRHYGLMLRHMYEVFFYRCNALYESEIKVSYFLQNWPLCTYVYNMNWFLITYNKRCFSKTKPEVPINRLSPPIVIENNKIKEIKWDKTFLECTYLFDCDFNAAHLNIDEMLTQTDENALR
jgi:hypothetical protein